MDIIEAIKVRHSVRKYTSRPLEENIVSLIRDEVRKCNKQSGLNIQFLVNEPDGFSFCVANYGKITGVTNYLALVGPDDESTSEKAGYYGEHLVLFAQRLGLNSCWVALTYNKKKAKIKVGDREKLVCVIALGYGENYGVPHKSKNIADCATFSDNDPEWYLRGVDTAMLAPTAINQQSFKISRNGNLVKIVDTIGVYTKVDLGIVKYHFEMGAGKENFVWQDVK